jgi:integrase
MPAIVRRSDGYYCAAVQVNGKRKFVYGRTEREVAEKLKEVEKQVLLHKNLPDYSKTVGDLIDYFLKIVQPSLKPKTYATYEFVCEKYIRPMIGKTKTARLDAMKIQAMYAECQKRGKRIPSMVHAVLSRMLRMAWKMGWLSEDVMEKVEKPGYRAPEKQVWDEEQVARFVEGTREDWLWPFFVFLVSTGARLGEAMALEWGDVDIRRGMVTIRRSMARVKGQWQRTKPKTKAGERTISLPQIAVEALKKQWTWQSEMRLKKGWTESRLVFTNLEGGVLEEKTIRRRFTEAIERLGLPRITIHSLRHTHASILLANRTDIATVSRRLGHANSAITLAVYTHFVRQDDEHVARLFEEKVRAKA